MNDRHALNVWVAGGSPSVHTDVTSDETPGGWLDCIQVAQEIVQAWETEALSSRLLSVREAADLIERIARALDAAYEAGRSSPRAS